MGTWLLLILLSCTFVFCEKCVTYNFEEDFENSFTFNDGMCFGHSPWELQQYDSSNITSPFNKSTVFIAPTENVIISCTSSFKFPVHDKGRLEVNVYMESVPIESTISVVLLNDNLGTIVNLGHSPGQPDFKPGWTVLRLDVSGHHNAHVSIINILLYIK
jgi:hypothetical protein